ncbi:MAG TPA: response regulator transcription factor [Bryobacteraceae bacterium]|nr:response regulator transcription factor [Bryobacteraceae bacterium]
MRILIAAETAVARAGLEAVIAQSPAFSLAGSADPAVLAERIRELQPDVVLLEHRGAMEDAIEPLLASGPISVLLTDREDAAAILALPHSGLRAVLPLDAAAHEILAAIAAAMEGLIVLHRDLLASLPIAGPAPQTPATPDGSLTPREIEVLRMLAEGLANKNIAWKLGISEHTVKFHITSIFTKLNVSSRAEAVATGMRRGLILL